LQVPQKAAAVRRLSPYFNGLLTVRFPKSARNAVQKPADARSIVMDGNSGNTDRSSLVFS